MSNVKLFLSVFIVTSSCHLLGGQSQAISQDLLNPLGRRTALRIPPASANHPMVQVIKEAAVHSKYIRENISDYSCVVVRQERIHGRLGKHEFIYAKVRNRRIENNRVVVPFSVYLKFLKPSRVKGREVLFVEGQNNGDMFARRGGPRLAFITTRLKPNSSLAMHDNRYPITEFGVENLVDRLIMAAHEDLKTDCKVSFLPDAKINNRPCTGFVVNHADQAANPEVCQVKVFIDQEHRVPVHYEAYDWPENEGEKPLLLERYTYMKLKLNNGFSDADFSPDNPNYRVQ